MAFNRKSAKNRTIVAGDVFATNATRLFSWIPIFFKSRQTDVIHRSSSSYVHILFCSIRQTWCGVRPAFSEMGQCTFSMGDFLKTFCVDLEGGGYFDYWRFKIDIMMQNIMSQIPMGVYPNGMGQQVKMCSDMKDVQQAKATFKCGAKDDVEIVLLGVFYKRSASFFPSEKGRFEDEAI